MYWKRPTYLRRINLAGDFLTNISLDVHKLFYDSLEKKYRSFNQKELKYMVIFP